MCAAVYRQRHLVKATKVNAGLSESNGRLLLGIWRDSLHVTRGLTACTPGSAPGPTLVNECGKTLPFYVHEHTVSPGTTVRSSPIFVYVTVPVSVPRSSSGSVAMQAQAMYVRLYDHKKEVHNVSQRRQTRTEPRAQVTYAKIGEDRIYSKSVCIYSTSTSFNNHRQRVSYKILIIQGNIHSLFVYKR